MQPCRKDTEIDRGPGAVGANLGHQHRLHISLIQLGQELIDQVSDFGLRPGGGA